MKVLRHFFILFLFINPTAFAGNEPVTIIHLKYQTADSLVPMLQSTFAEKAKISGSKYTLLVRASNEELIQIRRLVQRLDVPPKMLTVSVWFSDHGKTIQHRRLLQDIKIYRSSQSDEASDVQRVRVLSGYSAFINTGQIAPTLSYASFGNGVMELAFDSQERSTGFYVRPRLVDDEVVIEISAQKEALNRFGQNKTDTSNLVTTVRAHLGQWIQVGGAMEKEYSSRVKNVFQTSDSSQRKMIYLRVDAQAK